MTDRRYHHGDLREALVAAGYEAARARGPQALGVRELAKAVGVSPAAAYRHFADLDHLVAAVSQRAREQLARTMLDALALLPAGDTPGAAWARLEAIGRAYVAFGAAEPQLFETAFTPCAPTERPMTRRPGTCWSRRSRTSRSSARRDGGRRLADALVAWSSVHGLGTLLSRGLVPADASGAATTAVLDGVKAALRA